MMTTEEVKLISDWHGEVLTKIPITCVVSDDDRTGMFRTFCEELSKASPNVLVTYRKGDEPDEPPALEIHSGLIYNAIPRGPELAPFLDILSLFGNGQPSAPESITTELENLKTPCLLKLFIAPECPHCPKMVQDLSPLTLKNDLVKLRIIDGLLFPEMAEPLDIKSAPTLLFDDHMRWTGQVPLGEILDFMLNRDPALISAASIESLLGDGKAGLLAHMMMEQQSIFPNYYDLLTSDQFSIRLGAMVAMEEIIEQDKRLAEQCVNPLWERFPDLDEQVRGDVVYIMGEAGNRDVIPKLETVLSGSYSRETLEAAKEALETITGKQ
ncbi:MAG: hypothetical protein GY846_25950 [Deltaproteobacteria bacterium]|nr:hypothetical protein [Deltaproteobacteria bacterium]